ncbi:MAG TPA: glycoside hydrolase domain-containing protein, partial [Polyangiaceae bacterium]|nr:glycoside hydrolase domain-containing protein [Polyangiaceae bacterium]
SLEVREPSTDMYGPSAGRGAYPDVLSPVSGGVTTNRQAYFDVEIPAQASPGTYAGELRVSEQVLSVELRVSTAAIELTRAPLVWVFYLPRELARAHGLPDVDAPALLDKEREYHQLFREHGAYLAADLPPARFAARREFLRGVAYWPVAIDTSSDEAITRDVAAWLALFHDSAVIPFAIPVDEPRTAEARQRARHVAEVMGRAGAGRPRLLRAVTDAWSTSYGESIDVYISPANFPRRASERRASGERFWTYNGRPPGAGSSIVDTDGVALRSWGWIAERYDVELWYAWEGLYFSDRYNGRGATDVLREPLTFDERARGGSDWGNGDGVLAYPGPRPSLRLKALRRGLQDRLLLRALSSCGGTAAARRLAERVVPRALGEATGAQSWSIDEAVWEGARLETLDAIERDCHEQADLAH